MVKLNGIKPEGIAVLLLYDTLMLSFGKNMNPLLAGTILPALIVLVLGFVVAWVKNIGTGIYLSAAMGFIHGFFFLTDPAMNDVPQVAMVMVFTVFCAFLFAFAGLAGGVFAAIIKRLVA